MDDGGRPNNPGRGWVVRCARLGVVLAATAAGVALLPATALATTTTVTNTNDDGVGSLRYAIEASSPGDTIDFDASLSGGTITLSSGELLIGNSLTITGLGANNLTISGGGTSRVFDINASGGTVSISGLKVDGGEAPAGPSIDGDGGGILVRAGTFNLTDAAVSGNVTTGTGSTTNTCSAYCGSGGGISNDSTSTTTLTNVTVSGNATDATETCGGVASENSGALVIDDSTISGNQSGWGGGVCTEGGGNVTISGSTILGNSAQGATGTAHGTIEAEGGGFVEDDGGTTTITDSTFQGNVAYGVGGALAEDGGGTINISGSELLGNTADAVSNCTFGGPNFGTPCDSEGDGAGGAIGEDGGGGVTVRQSSIYGSTAQGNGGALAVFTGHDSIIDTTIYGNTAAAAGAINVGRGFSAASVSLFEDTLDLNSATSGSGSLGACDAPGENNATDNGTCSGNASITVGGTIVSRGTPTNCATANGGTISSERYNLDTGSSCGFAATGDQSSTDPKLGSAQQTVGPPPLYYEPLDADSPAIDTGNPAAECEAFDEIAQPRPDNGESNCDIGAYEFQDAATSTLTVARAGSGTGTVTSTDGDIDCGATCAQSYATGTTVTLNAAPDTGSTFGGWSGGGCSGTGSCMVTMNSSQTVTATFTMTGGGGGNPPPPSGNATPTVQVTSDANPSVFGQGVSFTARVSPSPTCSGVRWLVDGAQQGDLTPISQGTPASGNAITFSFGPLTDLGVGSHGVQVVFPGCTGYNEADAQVVQVVGKAATTTTASVSPSALSATVAPVSPGAGSPTGVVTFAVDGTVVGSANVGPDGTATLDYAGGAGHGVTATYGGDADFAGSSGSTNAATRNPTITARLSSAHHRTAAGWYRSPVTVTFSCTAGSAPLAAPGCPAAVRLTHQGAAQSVTRSITATDGGTASVTVSPIDIDLTDPTVTVTGARDGHTYRFAHRHRHLTCAATDQLSGVASCTVSKTHVTHVHTKVWHYTVTATDRAGNVATVTGEYRTKRHHRK